MTNSKKNIAEAVWELIEPTVEANGCFLWDIEYVKEGTRQILRITIDRENGVDIIHCEAVHRAIDPILDEADPIPVAYYLEVSSPGVEREIRLPWHYERCVGQKVDVKLYTSFEGQKQFTATLSGFDGENKAAVFDDRTIPLDKISKVSLHYDFEK